MQNILKIYATILKNIIYTVGYCENDLSCPKHPRKKRRTCADLRHTQIKKL